jgi:hypothetical protein
VHEEEGPEMRDKLRHDRTVTVKEYIEKIKEIPTSMDFFYNRKEWDLSPEEEAEAAAAKAAAKDKKGKGKDDKKKDDKKDAKKGEWGRGGGGGRRGCGGGRALTTGPTDKKGKKGDDEAKEVEMPSLNGCTELTKEMKKKAEEYKDVWEERDESSNFVQKHDPELAKVRIIRADVEAELKDAVDKMLVLSLEKINAKPKKAPKKPKQEKKPMA